MNYIDECPQCEQINKLIRWWDDGIEWCGCAKCFEEYGESTKLTYSQLTMDKQRLERLKTIPPGRITIDNILWLFEQIEQLTATLAQSQILRLQAEQEIDRLRSQLDWSRQRSVSWSRKVLPG